LGEVAAWLKLGEPVEFPPEVLQQAWVSRADVDKTGRRFAVGCVVSLAVAIAAALAFAALR
jgi:hypothetical protein